MCLHSHTKITMNRYLRNLTNGKQHYIVAWLSNPSLFTKTRKGVQDLARKEHKRELKYGGNNNVTNFDLVILTI